MYKIYCYRSSYIEILGNKILVLIYRNVGVDNLDFKRITIDFGVTLSLFLFRRNKLFK